MSNCENCAFKNKCEKYSECLTLQEKLETYVDECQRLKELLKECQHMIIAYSINHDTFTKEKVIDIVKQIDNTIGEKK